MAQVSRLANASVLPQRCLLAQAVAFSLALSGSAHAATFNVTTAADSGAGSLRDAVAQANSTAGADVITFNAGLGTITLTTGQIDITETLTITGPAAGQTISGNDSSRIFAVTAANQPLTLENLTLTAGATTATSPFPETCTVDTGAGGAVCTLSPLTLTNSTVSDNSTAGYGTHGGALFVNADATLTNSTISGNSTAGDRARGGALFVYGKVTLNNSTISENSTAGNYAYGGGFFVDGETTLSDSVVSGNSTAGDNAYGGGFTVFGVTTLTNSTVSDNSTVGYAAHGGGLYVAGEFMLSNSTVSGNSTAGASALGGGLYMAGPATLTNSTISGNSTAGINAHGGGLFMNGRITISNSTIAGNSTADADADGGGLFAISFNRTATLSNTILAANTGAGGNFVAVSTTLNASYSLLGDDASEINGINSNNVFNDVPGLAALADNGCTQPAGAPGSAACVQTQALQAGSPALDAADSAVCTAAPVNGLDQRGGLRGFNATGTRTIRARRL
ncbi:MAG: right-handed parallel beta-helix repeat-containing protein [Gammaproteobacteria bacterium]